MTPAAPGRSRALLLACVLTGLMPLLLPFSRSAELPVLLGVLVAMIVLWRRQPPAVAARPVLAAIGAYALAALVSTVDAQSPAVSLETALASMRLVLFLVGVAALASIARMQGHTGVAAARWPALAAAIGIGLWTLDGLVQAASGHSLGGPADADRLSGIFGADDLKLGPLLGALAPLLLWPLSDGPRWRLALAWAAVLVVVLLAGARAGWASYGLVTLLLAWRIAGASPLRFLTMLVLAAGLSALTGILAYQGSERFQARVDRTLSASSGDLERALAGRDWIWQASADMIATHPVNGVGVRGFRHAYAAHALPGDPWVDPQTGLGAAHAHQVVLEVLSETGALGLVLWLTAALLLWRVARALPPAGAVRAPFVALGVLVFPLNTHLAFYSTFMGLVLAWLLALCAIQATLTGEGGDGA